MCFNTLKYSKFKTHKIFKKNVSTLHLVLENFIQYNNKDNFCTTFFKVLFFKKGKILEQLTELQTKTVFHCDFENVRHFFNSF